MVFERGPRAFIDGTVQFLREYIAEGSTMQHLCQSASAYISERIVVLSTLRCALATFLAEVCLLLFFVCFFFPCLKLWVCGSGRMCEYT